MKNRSACKKIHYGIKIGLVSSDKTKKPIMLNHSLSEMEYYLIKRANDDQKILIISQIIRNLEKKGMMI